jgi:hypothetical protein
VRIGLDPRVEQRASGRRRRRRQMRLLRTVLIAVVVVVIAVVVTGGGGGTHHAPKGATSSTSTVARGTPAAPGATASPTTQAPPAAFTIAHLPAVLPQAVSRASVVVSNNRLIVLGGLHGRPTGTSTTQVLTVDPTTGTAVVDAPLAVATHDAAATTIAGSVYVFGGGEASTVAVVQQWRTAGSRVVGHLPQARSDVVAVSVAGHSYVLGGFDGARPTPDVLETDDGITFHVAATLPVPVRYPAVAVVGSTIYLVGGQAVSGAGGNGPPVTAVQAINVATGSATVVSQLPGSVTEASAFVVRGAIFLAGGVRGGIVQRGVFRLDPATGALTPIATLPEARADAAVAQIADTTYLVGGEGPSRLSSVVALQPA